MTGMNRDTRALHERRRPVLAALTALLLGASGTASAVESPAPFDPARVAWSEARLEARKLFQSMTVDIRVEDLATAEAQKRLADEGSHASFAAVDPAVALHYTSDGLGRRNEVELILEGATGRVLQRRSLETGKRLKYRVYRFGDDGALRRTWRPRPGEEDAAPETWSDRSEQWFPVADRLSGEAVSEPGAMVYLMTASDLRSVGDRLLVHAFLSSDETVSRMEAEVMSPHGVEYDYRLVTPTGDAGRSGRTETIRIAIRGLPAPDDDDGDDGDELTLFGMTDVELLLDPPTRAPLELRGRIGLFGTVHFRLDRLSPAQ
jgi:hypothetical protein